MSEQSRERLDLYLIRMGFASSRREAREMVGRGCVRVNGRKPGKATLVGGEDVVEVEALPSARPIEPEPEARLDVLFEDEALLVVNKPGAVPCHPLRPGERGTVMNAVVARYPETASAGDKPTEGGLVHRLDNGTSGALVVARTSAAFEALRRAIRSGTIRRRYLALILGHPKHAMTLDAPVAHHPKSARRMVVAASDTEAHKLRARPALSRVEPLRPVGPFSLVQVIPATGARHQIRVHLAAAGFPIVGDTLYGGPSMPGLEPGRFWLHLEEIEMESPVGGRIKVNAALPADLRDVLVSEERPESTPANASRRKTD